MTITREQAWKLAELARTIRPSWDELHLTDVIQSCGETHDLADVAHAVVRTAADPDMLKPGSIKFFDSPHWQRTSKPAETPAERAHREQEERRQLAAEKAAAAGPERSAPHRDLARRLIAEGRQRAAATRNANTEQEQT